MDTHSVTSFVMRVRHLVMSGACSLCLSLTYLGAVQAQDVPADERAIETAPAEDASDAQAQRPLKPAENVDLSDVVVPPIDAAPNATADASVADTPELTGSESPADPSEDRDQASDTAATLPPPSPADIDAAVPDTQAPARQETLVLLNTEVPAGTTTRLAWSPQVSFMGVSAPTPVLVVNGVSPGPTLCLTAAVHGDETNGIETVRRVLYSIDAEKLSGAVIGVPIVNLEGFRAGSRYLPDRRDLNRFFPGNNTGSAASRIAYSFFNEVISQCDMLIDTHTGSFGRTNLHQLRADLEAPGVLELAEKMGRIVVVQSRGAKGTLRRAAVEAGIPAVTLEAGAPNMLDKAVVEESVKSIKNAMGGLELLRQRSWRRRADAPVFYESYWVRASEGGFLISEAKLGATVKMNQLLGVVTNPITNERSEIRSPFAGRVIGMALNQVMQPGYAAYHLGVRPVVATDAEAGEGVAGTGTATSLRNAGVRNAEASSATGDTALGFLYNEEQESEEAEAGR